MPFRPSQVVPVLHWVRLKRVFLGCAFKVKWHTGYIYHSPSSLSSRLEELSWSVPTACCFYLSKLFGSPIFEKRPTEKNRHDPRSARARPRIRVAPGSLGSTQATYSSRCLSVPRAGRFDWTVSSKQPVRGTHDLLCPPVWAPDGRFFASSVCMHSYGERVSLEPCPSTKTLIIDTSDTRERNIFELFSNQRVRTLGTLPCMATWCVWAHYISTMGRRRPREPTLWSRRESSIRIDKNLTLGKKTLSSLVLTLSLALLPSHLFSKPARQARGTPNGIRGYTEFSPRSYAGTK